MVILKMKLQTIIDVICFNNSKVNKKYKLGEMNYLLNWLCSHLIVAKLLMYL